MIQRLLWLSVATTHELLVSQTLFPIYFGLLAAKDQLIHYFLVEYVGSLPLHSIRTLHAVSVRSDQLHRKREGRSHPRSAVYLFNLLNSASCNSILRS